MTIIIGVGSGRCGTRSLGSFINLQPGTVCFHEINPAAMTWDSTPQPVLSMVREFSDVLAGGPRQLTIDYASPHRDRPLDRLRSLPAVHTIGDIASYYLTYVPMLADLRGDIVFPCLRRDRSATVRSFVDKLRTASTRRRALGLRLKSLVDGEPYTTHRNHWAKHSNGHWARDSLWDKCFPRIEADTLEQAIGQYWDLYYATAEAYERRFPGRFKVFDIGALNDEAGQRAILEFLGLEGDLVFKAVWSNRNKAARSAAAATPPPQA